MNIQGEGRERDKSRGNDNKTNYIQEGSNVH